MVDTTTDTTIVDLSWSFMFCEEVIAKQHKTTKGKNNGKTRSNTETKRRNKKR